jgi:hypothetical protein
MNKFMSIWKKVKYEIHYLWEYGWLNPSNWQIVIDIQKYRYYKKHGYFPADWWEYGSENAMRTVKCLRRLRDEGHGVSGSPHVHAVTTSSEERSEWVKILDEIIWAWEEILVCLYDFDECVKVCGKERFAHIGTFTFEDNIFSNPPVLHEVEKNYTLRYELVHRREFILNSPGYQVQTRADYDRMLNGFKLYQQYYFSFWD